MSWSTSNDSPTLPVGGELMTKITRRSVDVETERSINEIASSFAEGFVTKMFSDGILQEISMNQLQTYLANPDNYIRELENIANYYYITSGEVFQLFDLAKVLPTLNHKIVVYDKSKNYEKNLMLCNKILNKVKHKQLTRDIISQTISAGTLTGIWLGDKKKPYLYIFDRVDKAFPAYRLNGEWVVQLDLSWLTEMKDIEREVFIKNLSPFVTKQQYETYKGNPNETNRYVDLPQDRTVSIRTHSLKRNQSHGLNWSLTGLYDLQHKKKLKDLEKSIANKIISAIAVLTIGSDKNDGVQSNLKLNKELKRKIHAGVKAALEKNQSQGVTVVSIPDFADIKFPEMKSDALDPKKFESINSDVTSSYGYSRGLTNGEGGNFASLKMNLDIFYKKIAVLLEDIETEVYAKLFNLILPQSISDEYLMVYDKEPPLTLKEKVDILMKLHSQEGFSLKAVVDLMSGIDFTEYVNQSIYEQDILKLQEKIKPYQSAYTSNGTSQTGRPEVDNPTDNTVKSKTNDSNSTPSG